MSRTVLSFALVIVVVVSAAGCADVSQNPKTAVGAAGGAAAGGLIGAAAGHTPAAIAGGVILGGLVGGAVGNVLDQRDRQLAAQAAQQALETAPTGGAVPWTNPDNGHTGTVTPVRTYQAAGGAIVGSTSRS